MTKMTTGTKHFSSKQENLIADLLGWKVVTGSGARSLHPGDIQSDEWLGECKTHETPSHKIVFYSSVWKKISDEAISKYRFPALFVDDGSQTVRHTWVMYKTLPAVSYITSDYPYPVKSNISFDSLDMMTDRKSKNIALPLVYKVRQGKETVFISTLEDFNLMFGSK